MVPCSFFVLALYTSAPWLFSLCLLSLLLFSFSLLITIPCFYSVFSCILSILFNFVDVRKIRENLITFKQSSSKWLYTNEWWFWFSNTQEKSNARENSAALRAKFQQKSHTDPQNTPKRGYPDHPGVFEKDDPTQEAEADRGRPSHPAGPP